MKKVIGLLLFLATTVCVFATDDHSDVRILATLINPNSTTPGRINTIGDVDFFKVQIPRAGTLTIGTTGSTNTYGSLLDSEGGYIVANDGGLSNNFRISRSVTAGIYYIRVRHLFYMTGTGPYSLVSQFTSDQTEGSNNTSTKPRISTRAFGGGCITKVGNYAKRQTCNDSNTQQNLEYSINRLKNPRLKNPSSNQCLTVQSHDNGSKIVFAPCQDDNQEQNFSYHSDTHKFVHTVFSNKCLDIHGRNRTDLILWSCHGGVNQQFYIQPGTQQSNTDSSASQRPINTESQVSTHAFGGGCITKVGDYAKRRTCSTSNDNQSLTYTSNRALRDPASNKCLTAQSYNNGSKIIYAQCQENSAEQIFSYLEKTKRFLHIASHKCLDIHGGNKTDLILWRCHGGTNQKFYIPSPRTGGSDDHGNDRSRATVVKLHSTTSGSIEIAEDVDYFKIVVPRSGRLIVNTTGLTDTYGCLLDAQGSYVRVGDDNSGLNRNFKLSQNVTAGTYYVTVRHHNFSSGLGRYSLVVNFILPNSDNRGHSRDTAIPISQNSTTSGNIKLPGDSNYYKIVIPSAGKLTIYTTGSTDTLGYFLNASGGRIALDDDAGSYSNFNIEERVTAGTYYVKVQHNSSGGTGRYSLVVNFTLQRSDDHGNSMNAATTTRLNGRISGSIEVAGDEDWFKVVMPRTGILMIQTLGQTDTVGYLYNADGSQITADNNGGSGHNFLIIRSVAAGTYYVRVKHPSSSGIGTYWLDISLESDHGGYVYTATAINPNSTTPGRLQIARDNDYFRIGIPSTGTLVVHTTGPTDTVGYLLNANWDQIALDDNGGSGRNFRISKRVTAGTYYIKVKLHTSAATGPYSLISRFTPTQAGQTQGIDNSTSRGSSNMGLVGSNRARHIGR